MLSFLLHTKSIPFYITLVKRAVTDISPGQLLHTVCFTCKHTYVHKPLPPQQRKQKKTCKPSGPSQLFPLSLPLVPFNILRQVKVFWVALNSAAPIIPVHITTVLTCSDCNLRRDVSISEFKSVFFPPFMILSCDWQGTECECDIWQAVTRTQTDNFVNTKHVFTDSETQGVNITRRPEWTLTAQMYISVSGWPFAYSSGYYSNGRVNSKQPAAFWSVHLWISLLMYFQLKEQSAPGRTIKAVPTRQK